MTLRLVLACLLMAAGVSGWLSANALGAALHQCSGGSDCADARTVGIAAGVLALACVAGFLCVLRRVRSARDA